MIAMLARRERTPDADTEEARCPFCPKRGKIGEKETLDGQIIDLTAEVHQSFQSVRSFRTVGQTTSSRIVTGMHPPWHGP